jgi:hypothetical protein
MQTPASRVIILRHDVDRRPGNALKTARLEHDPGIPASCCFRGCAGKLERSWGQAWLVGLLSGGGVSLALLRF